MELSGDEKRIQALFSELALENKIGAPPFEILLTRAQSTRHAPRRVFIAGAAVVVTALVIAATTLLATWDSSPPPSLDAVNITPREISIQPTELTIETDRAKSRPVRQKKVMRPKKVERTVTREALLFSSWQSPTATFMQSPGGSALSSLPQLNQSVQDLKDFLSKNNEVMKESNR
jgi:hypothetical protein